MSEGRTEKAAPTIGVTAQDFGTLVQSIRDIADASQSGKRKMVDEVLIKTPQDPQGSLGGVREKTCRWEHVYQNGSEVNAEVLYDEEIDLLNKFTRSGVYNHKKWGVRVDKHAKTIDISYPNKTVGDRLDLSRTAIGKHNTGFANMLQIILMEQESRDQKRRRGEIDEDDE